jgi:hypothetical protein
LGSNYAREGRNKKCETWRRGRGFYRGGGGSPQGGCTSPKEVLLLLIMVVTSLFIPFMVVTPSST